MEAFLEAARIWGRLALTFARRELGAARNRVGDAQPPSEADVQDQLSKLADTLSMAST
jgi:hypothetical protein